MDINTILGWFSVIDTKVKRKTAIEAWRSELTFEVFSVKKGFYN